MDGGGQGFSGDILYNYEGRNQSLYDMCGKLLLSTNTDAQTFTKERSFSQLSASNGVTTGPGPDTTDEVYVGAKNFNIKNLYDSSFKLDQDNVITSTNFQIQHELKVSKDVEVSGKVETVDIIALAEDLVVNSEADLTYTDPDGAIVTVSSNSKVVSVPGKKTFSKPLTVSNNIASTGHVVVTADGADRTFTSSDGSKFVNRILKKSGDSQTVSTNIELNGNVQIDGNLIADSIDDVSFSSIAAKYGYKSAGNIHELKTKFEFSGPAITVSDLKTASVRGRNWDKFVGDILPKTCNFPIKANHLVATLPTWGKFLSLSFEVLVQSFHPTSTWSEFLRFTSGENDNNKPGDRIPAIFIQNKEKAIYVGSQVGNERNFHHVGYSIEAGIWTKVEINHYAENGKIMYEVLVDGVRKVKMVNTVPTEYENVKVWAALDTWYPSVDGRIRNLKAGKIANSIFSFIIMNNFLDDVCLLDVCCPLVDGGNDKYSYYASFVNLI